MGAALNNLQHIVVLMMENRSFDHMLGGLKKEHPMIDGLTGNEANPDTTGAMVQVSPSAKFEGQLKDDPDHHFPGVDLQVFGGSENNGRVANMQGFCWKRKKVGPRIVKRPLLVSGGLGIIFTEGS